MLLEVFQPNTPGIYPGFFCFIAFPCLSFIASDHWYHGLPVSRRMILPLLGERAGVGGRNFFLPGHLFPLKPPANSGCLAAARV
jgi:hypothetical protein